MSWESEHCSIYILVGKMNGHCNTHYNIMNIAVGAIVNGSILHEFMTIMHMV